MVLDVNVLIALFRGDSVHHEAASSWWVSAADSGEPFTVTDSVWASFVRIATNRRAWDVPASFGDAWTFATEVMAQPTYRRHVDGRDILGHFERFCRQANATANLVTDAYIGACAHACGATVVTFDRDFRKFDGLRVLELTA